MKAGGKGEIKEIAVQIFERRFVFFAAGYRVGQQFAGPDDFLEPQTPSGVGDCQVQKLKSPGNSIVV